MLLRIVKLLQLQFIAVFLTACATTGGDISASNSIVKSGNWFMLGNTVNGDTYYYDPYKKIDDGNGNVETLIYATKPSSSKTITVDLIKVNCDQKLFQLYKINRQGGWELYQDWTKAEDNSPARALFVNSLCRERNKENELIEFIVFTPKQGMPNRFNGWYWVVDKTYEPSIKNGKTLKVIYKDPKEAQSYYMYMVADCNGKRMAQSPKLSTENLQWMNSADKTSPAAFLYRKSCNSELPATPEKQNKTTTTNNSSGTDINDAKSKCSELGFKKGTEQFGNCVLKLTK